MKLIKFFLNLYKKEEQKPAIFGRREDLLIKTAAQQFKKLQELGLQIPIAAL